MSDKLASTLDSVIDLDSLNNQTLMSSKNLPEKKEENKKIKEPEKKGMTRMEIMTMRLKKKKLEEKKKREEQKKLEQLERMKAIEKMQEEMNKSLKVKVVKLSPSLIFGLPEVTKGTDTSKQDDPLDHVETNKNNKKDAGHAGVGANSSAKLENDYNVNSGLESAGFWIIPSATTEDPEHPNNIVKTKYVLNHPIIISRNEKGKLVVRNMTNQEIKLCKENGQDPWEEANKLLETAVVLIDELFDREKYWQASVWIEAEDSHANLNGRLLIVPEEVSKVPDSFIENHFKDGKRFFSQKLDKATFLFVGSSYLQFGGDMIVCDTVKFKHFKKIDDFLEKDVIPIEMLDDTQFKDISVWEEQDY